MITEQDREFLEYIKMYRHIGYGRMIQIISYAWYEQLRRDQPGMEDGAFVGRCLAFLPEGEKREYLLGLRSEKAQGMDY